MRTVILVLGACALAGCGGGGEGGSGAGGEMAEAKAAAARAAATFEPGEWRVTTRITAVDMPGMPPAVAKQMASRETSVTHCMTEEEARRSPEDMFRKAGEGQCEYKDFNMAGGAVSGTMTCSGGPGGGTSTVEMSGRYGATSFTSSSKLMVTTPGSAGAMTMSAVTEGKRLGACGASEEKAG